MNMGFTDEYTTIATDNVANAVYTEKRSKFLAFAVHAETEEQVKDIVDCYRKKYFDARHVCYAFKIGHDSDILERANDDGEPSSTAGKPILGQITKSGLTDILIIVVRYFGGVKLGTGGLIVAYKTAAAAALSEAQTEKRVIEENVSYTFPYIMMNDVMKVVKDMKPRIIGQQFDNTCTITLAIRKAYAQQLRDRLANLAF